MKFTYLVATAVAGVVSSNALAAVVSVNIIQNTGNDGQQIDADETFGVGTVFGVNTTVGNWTNTNSTSASNLITSTGAASTVGFAATQPNGQATFNAAYSDTPLFAGFDDYTTTPSTSPVSITLSNLNANFPDGYVAIVYVGGFNANTGASITNGSSTFYYRALPSPTAPVSFVQTTQTSDLGAGNNPTAQYAIFGSNLTPLTSNSMTFTVDTLAGGGSALAGVQVIGIPEPASAALLGLAGLFLRRRSHA